MNPPASLAVIGGRVASRIDSLLATEQARWAAVDPLLNEPYSALRRIISSGKRLRPAFCHWGWVAAGGAEDDARIVDAGAGLELLHMFALAHDDIMDGSATRHGVTALHVDFAARAEGRGWRDSRRFGDGAAILIGDVAFVYADHLLSNLTGDAKVVYDELRLEVNVGQYLDLVGTAAGAASFGQARNIAIYKSGKYTIERPLHLGAALAGDTTLLPTFTAYGVPLGEAFQLRDDLLGAFGAPDVLGKPVGDDLRSGKPTVLLALARDAGAALERVGANDLSDDEISALQAELLGCGAVDAVEGIITARLAEAVGALDHGPIAAPVKSELTQLAKYVTDRDH